MPVALDDLRRSGSRTETKRLANFVFDIGWNVGMGANRAREFANPHFFASEAQALQLTAQLVIPNRKLEPERGWLRVNAVCAADHERFSIANGLVADDVDQTLEVGLQDRTGVLNQNRERSID